MNNKKISSINSVPSMGIFTLVLAFLDSSLYKSNLGVRLNSPPYLKNPCTTPKNIRISKLVPQNKNNGIRTICQSGLLARIIATE